MIYFNNKISPRQLFIMIIMSYTGTTCLFVTDINVKYAGKFGFASIIITSLLALILTYIGLYVCRKTDYNFIKFLDDRVNIAIRRFIYILFAVKYIFLLSFAGMAMARLVRTEILTEVSTIWILAIITIVVIYVSDLDIENRARLLEVLVFPALIIFFIFCIYGMGKVNLYRLKSNESAAIWGVIKAIIINVLLFVHPEMILLTADKVNTDNIKKYEKSVYIGVITVVIANLITYVETAGSISINVIKAGNDGVLRLIKIFKLPYLSLERQGGLFIMFFILGIYFAIMSLVFHLGRVLEMSGIRRNKMRLLTISLLFIVGMTALYYSRIPYFNSIRRETDSKTEIEDRLYAGFMMIDKQNDNYEVLISYEMEDLENKRDVLALEKLEDLKKISGMEEYKHLDLSHVKVVLVNEELIRNRQEIGSIIKYIEKENQLSDALLLGCTSQNIREFEGGVSNIGTEPGKYISKLADNNTEINKSRYYNACLWYFGTDDKFEVAEFVADKNVIRYIGNKKIF